MKNQKREEGEIFFNRGDPGVEKREERRMRRL